MLCPSTYVLSISSTDQTGTQSGRWASQAIETENWTSKSARWSQERSIHSVTFVSCLWRYIASGIYHGNSSRTKAHAHSMLKIRNPNSLSHNYAQLSMAATGLLKLMGLDRCLTCLESCSGGWLGMWKTSCPIYPQSQLMGTNSFFQCKWSTGV